MISTQFILYTNLSCIEKDFTSELRKIAGDFDRGETSLDQKLVLEVYNKIYI